MSAHSSEPGLTDSKDKEKNCDCPPDVDDVELGTDDESHNSSCDDSACSEDDQHQQDGEDFEERIDDAVIEEEIMHEIDGPTVRKMRWYFLFLFNCIFYESSHNLFFVKVQRFESAQAYCDGDFNDQLYDCGIFCGHCHGFPCTLVRCLPYGF